MIYSQAIAPENNFLANTQTTESIQTGLNCTLDGQRVLVLIPDHTRSLPLPFLFRTLVEILRNAKQLDFMVALGTHPPLSEKSLQNSLVLPRRNKG